MARGRLVVTNHRLIFRHLFQGVAYPLRYISRINETRFVFAPVVQLDFVDGGSEQFGVFGVPEWIGFIEQAKVTAPVVSNATQASSAPQSSITNGLLIAVTVGLISLCGCMILSALLAFASMRFR
jgi:hypothetical protein